MREVGINGAEYGPGIEVSKQPDAATKDGLGVQRIGNAKARLKGNRFNAGDNRMIARLE